MADDGGFVKPSIDPVALRVCHSCFTRIVPRRIGMNQPSPTGFSQNFLDIATSEVNPGDQGRIGD